MAVSSRHLHRRNLRSESDRDPDEPSPAVSHASEAMPSSPTADRSSAVLDALSDGTSKLARFLFAGDEDDSDNDMPRMNEWEAQWYALILEPTPIRNERVIMLFEAYAIFGALFMNAVWIIYEWSSWKGYGGEGTNVVVERIFESIIAFALCCNLLLALFGAWYWIYSINMATSSHEDFAMASIKPLVNLHSLLSFTGNLVLIGLLLGVYLNLSPYLPETIIIIIIAFVIAFVGSCISDEHILACAPLEMYHVPQIVLGGMIWIKGISPSWWFTRKKIDELKAQAKIRAQRLKNSAYRERNELSPSSSKQTGSIRSSDSSVGKLLRAAAKNLNRSDVDITIYEDRLEKDWLIKPEQLKVMSLECLSQYMPVGLAIEVQNLVKAEQCTS